MGFFLFGRCGCKLVPVLDGALGFLVFHEDEPFSLFLDEEGNEVDVGDFFGAFGVAFGVAEHAGFMGSGSIAPALGEAEFNGGFDLTGFGVEEIGVPFFEGIGEEVGRVLGSRDEDAIGMAGGAVALEVTLMDGAGNFAPVGIEFGKAGLVFTREQGGDGQSEKKEGAVNHGGQKNWAIRARLMIPSQESVRSFQNSSRESRSMRITTLI